MFLDPQMLVCYDQGKPRQEAPPLGGGDRLMGAQWTNLMEYPQI